jgi:DNA-binding transcriptional ArsR family regulator
MPLHMRLRTEDLTRCRFAVSPLCQTHEALRLLRRPERHRYHRAWLARVRDAAAGLDLSDLWLFMPRGRGYTPDFLGPPPEGPSGVFEDELARMRATDPAMARTEMARSLECTPGALESPRGQRLLADPVAAVGLLADITARAWQMLLAPDWPRLRAVLEADIAYRSRRLASGGLEALFADLDTRVVWSPDTGTLRVSEVFPGFPVTQRLDGRGVLLMPSVFVWPDVVSGFAPPWQPTILYPARGIGELWGRSDRPGAGATGTGPADGPGSGRPDEPLVRLLGANRARLLAGLAAPASTTELAHRLGLAASSVSGHLAVLRGAGLLTSRRHGHQVLYERTELGRRLAAPYERP